MSFASFFKHIPKPNPHNVAGALGAAKATLDTIGAAEHFAWLPDFDKAAGTAITSLNAWQPGQPTDQVAQSLNAAVAVVNGIPDHNIDSKTKAIISVFVGAAETALAFVGPATQKAAGV